MSRIDDLYTDWLNAEAEWVKQIKLHLKGCPGDLRYTAAAKGEPGSDLRKAYDAWEAAADKYRRCVREILRNQKEGELLWDGWA